MIAAAFFVENNTQQSGKGFKRRFIKTGRLFSMIESTVAERVRWFGTCPIRPL